MAYIGSFFLYDFWKNSNPAIIQNPRKIVHDFSKKMEEKTWQKFDTECIEVPIKRDLKGIYNTN